MAERVQMLTIGRDKVLELCEALGHDPDQVSSMLIEHSMVTVQYVHPITDAPV